MHIPKRFKISGKVYTVRRPSYMRKHRTIGRCNPVARIVHVANGSNVTGRVFEREELAETFWHEAVHAILYDMPHSLARDEDFVTQFSSRLNELVQTAEL